MTKIWVQVGSVAEALDVVKNVSPDVLVVQGTDAGGHGLAQGAGLISLLPEVCDTIDALDLSSPPIIVAAGGLADARGASAALSLGASGVVLGTRLLASPEARISAGYQRAVLSATDGGQTTVRTKVYDALRGTNWAATHNARGVVNRSFVDAEQGMGLQENEALYKKEMERGDEGWGWEGRMTTYAGSGVGLVREVKGVGKIVREVREGVEGVLGRARERGRL